LFSVIPRIEGIGLGEDSGKKKWHVTGSCHLQNLPLRGTPLRFKETSKRPLHVETHKPYEKQETDRENRKIRPEEIIG